eukprot:SAG25_NODE_45_length_19261_cov_61.009815_6_plen_39_part_00
MLMTMTMMMMGCLDIYLATQYKWSGRDCLVGIPSTVYW